VLSALAIGHVYVRFAIGDVKLEHRTLQKRQRELFVNVTRLERENVAIADPERLRELGVDGLGMVNVLPEVRVQAALPQMLVDKYVHVGTPRGIVQPRDTALAAENRSPLMRVLMGVVDANRAYAKGDRE
jgi:hypothetical protein